MRYAFGKLEIIDVLRITEVGLYVKFPSRCMIEVGLTLYCILTCLMNCRYLDLTEEEKEKLKGSYKVAKKLEKLENIGQDR